MMNDLSYVLLFLRIMLWFVSAYLLFILATLCEGPMRSTCGALTAVFATLGVKEVLFYSSRSMLPADVVLTPLLVVLVGLLAASVYRLIRADSIRRALMSR